MISWTVNTSTRSVRSQFQTKPKLKHIDDGIMPVCLCSGAPYPAWTNKAQVKEDLALFSVETWHYFCNSNIYEIQSNRSLSKLNVQWLQETQNSLEVVHALPFYHCLIFFFYFFILILNFFLGWFHPFMTKLNDNCFKFIEELQD